MNPWKVVFLSVFLSLASSFVGLELQVPEAHGYAVQMVEGQPLRWGENQVSYRIHSAGSSDINNGSDLSAVQQGFNDWTSQSCTYVQINYAGTTTNLSVTSIGYSGNNQNEVVWLEGACTNASPSWCFGPYVLGVTAPLYYTDGTIIEADIAFNGLQSTWSTSGVAAPFTNQQDVLNVALHEEGHFLGIQHVLSDYDPNDPPTMITTADPNLLTATLHADDVNAVCFLYPVGGGFSCSSDDDCPYVLDEVNGQEVYTGKILCQNGTCGGITNPPPGEKQFGEVCGSNFDCIGDLVCQWTQDTKICTSECVPSQNNCPQDYACLAYNNAPNLGICLPSTGGTTQPGSKQVGEECASSTECSTGLCVAEWGSNTYLCRTPCNTSAPSCGASEACYALEQGSTNGACLPSDDPSPGLKANGESCDSANVCQSGLCVGNPDGSGYSCRGSCDTTNGSGCLSSEQCVALAGSGTQGACIPGSGGSTGINKPTGAPCTDSGECESGQCVSFSGEEGSWFCTAACAAQADCPCGLECVATTTMGNVCAPGEKLACIPDGNACAFPSECTSGACIFGVCTPKCTVLGGGCGPGQGCIPNDEFGNGYCSEQGAGLPGSVCSQHKECSSLVCSNATGSFLCSIPCDPLGANTCGSSMECWTWQGIGVCAPSESNPIPPDNGTVLTSDSGVLVDTATGGTSPNNGGGGTASSGGCATSSAPHPFTGFVLLGLLFLPLVLRRHLRPLLQS